MTPPDISPGQVYGLIVGIEQYQGEHFPTTPGAARDALEFAKWLCDRHKVPPGNISIFLSPLTDCYQQEARAIGLEDLKEAQGHLISETINTKFLPHKVPSPEKHLLYIFWGGHGFITEKHSIVTRRLVYGNTTEAHLKNLNFDSLQEALVKVHSGGRFGFKCQIFFIDTCADLAYPADYVSEFEVNQDIFKHKIPGYPSTAEQFFLFASAHYQKTEGDFSKELLRELNSDSSFPLVPSNEELNSLSDKLTTSLEGKLDKLWLKPKSSDEKEQLLINREPWHELSQQLLQLDDLEITTNPLTSWKGITDKVDEAPVPLILAERKKVPLVKSESPTAKSTIKQYPENQTNESQNKSDSDEQVEVTQFTQKQFLEKILSERQSQERQEKLIAIVGEPGAGKTTLLQEIALKILKDQKSIVIWVSSAKLEGRDLSKYVFEIWLKSIVERYAQRKVSEIDQEGFRSKCRQGHVWLLLDGLDEMQLSRNLREYFKDCRWILGVHIILTCRLNFWVANHYGLSDFQTYHTQPFIYPKDVDQFIQDWFGRRKRIQFGNRLCSELKDTGNGRIRDLIKNPLRLFLLCFNYYCDSKQPLPETQAELYKIFLDQYYKWKDSKNEFPINIKERDELNIKLGELSRALLDGKNKGGFSLQKQFVQEYLKERLFDLAIDIGLLQRVGRDAENQKEEVYKFTHDTFAEYFAARFFPKNKEVVAQEEEWDFFLPKNTPFRDRYRIFEPQWKQTILFWLGRKDIDDEKKTEFIDALIKFNDGCRIRNQKYKGFYEYRAYFLAAAGLAEFPGYPEEKANKIIENITTWSLDNHNPIRWAAHAALKETDRQKAIAFLEELIANSSDVDIVRMRKNAILTLGEIGSENAIEPLTKILENPDDPCRKYAADALGRTGSDSAIKPLIKIFLKNPDSDIRIRVAWALGKIGSESTINSLIQVLENPNDPCREYAAEALGQIGSESAIAPLFKALKESSEFFVRSKAARALGEIGSESAIYPLIEVLETPNSDENQYKLRSIAAEALGEIGSESASHPLIKVLKNPDSGYLLRQSAAEALGEIASKSAIHPLIKVLENPDYEYRVCLSTARTLGKIASESAIKFLIKENFDYDMHKRAWRETDAQAAFSLWRLFEDAFEDSVIGSHFLRQSAAEALGKIGSEAAIYPLIELLENPDSDVRQSAAEALGEIGSEAAINPLIELLENPTSDSSLKVSTQPYPSIGKPPQELGNIYDYRMCESVARALGKIGAEAAINPLIKLLENHASDSVRSSAAWALGKIGSECAIEPLIELLQKPDFYSFVHKSAARALGKIGSDSAINHLIELLNNPASGYSLHNVAAEVLENISAKPHQMVEVISALKYYSHQSKKCYQIIWQYSQNLPYPDFYEVWIKPLWLRRLQQCFANLFNFKKKKS